MVVIMMEHFVRLPVMTFVVEVEVAGPREMREAEGTQEVRLSIVAAVMFLQVVGGGCHRLKTLLSRE